jgi:low affinity Fe/Cu permease
MSRHQSLFASLSRQVSRAAGHPGTFVGAVGIVVMWALTGPVFQFSDTWQLVINTGTTVVTFLMVFLIQNTQNRDSVAMQIKLDELIRAIDEAQNALLDLEELTEDELEEIRRRYEHLARIARGELRGGGSGPLDRATLGEPLSARR